MTDVKDGKLSDFRPQKDNANAHTERGLKLLGNAYSEVGYVAPMTATADGEIIDGSARLEVAFDQFPDDALIVRHDGQRPVIMVREDIVSADTPEAKKISYSANRVGELDLAWNPETILADLDSGVDLSGLFREDELSEILGELGKNGQGELPEITETEAEKLAKEYDVHPGQVWQLGRHVIGCVDSTDRESVRQLFGDRRASLWVTDPPYGVSYADKNKWLNMIAPGNHIQTPIENDHNSMDELCDLWRNAALMAYEFTTDQAAYYWFACQGGDQMMMMMIGEKWKVRHELIWLKNNHVLGRADYNYKHEPILYGWKRDGTHKFYGGFQTSVFEVDKPVKSNLHPTTKPLELISKLIENSSQIDEVIYDGFLGSGTTLLACENLNRACIGADISPAYTATTIYQWEQATNQKAKLTNA